MMRDKIYNLEGKTALITGAGSGIGKAIAILFAKQGAQVILLGRNEEQLLRVQRTISTDQKISTERCPHYVCDLSHEEDIAQLALHLKLRYPRIDILINNAGIYKENKETHLFHPDGTITFNRKLIQELFQVNLFSYWQLSLHIAELMKLQREGIIINISSVNGICGKIVCDIYDMTKAAVNNLTLNQAMQLSSYNIRVNAICPSSTFTPMRDKAMSDNPPKGGTEWFNKFEESLIPLQRLAKPEEIAYSALSLAAEEGSYITGQIISVDGGFLLTKKFPILNSKD